jgi:hypothetical protein
MPYDVKCYADQQLILASLTNPLVVPSDPQNLIRCVADCMSQIHALPIYRILDLSGLVLSFGEMVFALAAETRDTPGSLSDPRVVHVIVTTDREICEAIAALQYPSIHIVSSTNAAFQWVYKDRMVGYSEVQPRLSNPLSPSHFKVDTLSLSKGVL